MQNEITPHPQGCLKSGVRILHPSRSRKVRLTTRNLHSSYLLHTDPLQSLLLHAVVSVSTVNIDGSMGVMDLENPGCRGDEKAKTLTYRVRGIPSGLDKAGAQSLLQDALGTRSSRGLIIDSLAAASSRQVATVRLSGRPEKLNGCKRQWQVSARGITMTVDTHFGGFTPLHDPETNAEPTFE